MGIGNCLGWFGWMGLVNFIVGLGFLALVVGGAIFGVRWLARASSAPADRGRDGALEVVRKRYARSEISQEEFDRLRRELA